MNRRKFVLLFGGSVAALALPGFQLPEVVPEALEPLPIAAGFRRLINLCAYGTATESRRGRIAVARIGGLNDYILLHRFNTFGGTIHHRFPIGDELIEVPGHELAIAADKSDITWCATWRNPDGSFEVTTAEGGEWQSSRQRPRAEWALKCVGELA